MTHRAAWVALAVFSLWLSSLAPAVRAATVSADRQPLDPAYPVVTAEQVVTRWSFERTNESWLALNQAALSLGPGKLVIVSTGEDPQLRLPIAPVRGPLVLTWRMRTAVPGSAEIFWGTTAGPDFNQARSLRVTTLSDGQWHDYSALLDIPETITALRFDPTTQSGQVEIADAQLIRRILHPLQLVELQVTGGTVAGKLLNTQTTNLNFTVGDQAFSAAPNQAVEFALTAPHQKPFETVTLEATLAGWPPLRRPLHLHHADLPGDWITFGNSNALVRVARDGSGARLFWKGQLAAVASPLAQRAGAAVALRPRVRADGIEFSGEPIQRLALRVEGDEVVFDVNASECITGPAIRAQGRLEQGLLAGVEYLEEGEASSSLLDVERPEHLRFEPDPLLLTLPLAACVTPTASVAVLWNDPALQPVFSTPNRYDGTPDHLAAVKGTNFQLRVRLGDGATAGGVLEDAILWAVKRRGLPEVPPAARSPEAERALCLRAFDESLRTSNGWFHAAWADAKAEFFADHASAVWALTGQVPPTPRLVPGGAHVDNPVSLFLTGRAGEWLRQVNAQAQGLRREQLPDGSFRYRGKYQRGHSENTASGLCARPAVVLLEHARLTGDTNSLAAGVRALEFMKHFRTPRGAQTWEVPLHTPDILASALLVQAYVRGYELTQRREYLELARRWAISGLPFVYQWDLYPVQRYGTIAVLGATDWTGVVWIGLPVQWCGTCYAWALTLLEPYDHTLDWRRVATGILRTAEQMQYSDGPLVGSLPDSFNLETQRRQPAGVNPCVLVWLQDRLAGKSVGLSVAQDAAHRILAPFPVTLQDGRATIAGRSGTTYQVIVDGQRVQQVISQGQDRLDLRTSN